MDAVGHHSLLIVIKIGTSSLIEETEILNKDGVVERETNLQIKQMAAVVEVVTALRRRGHKVVLVSSGAVGAGCHVLSLKERPKGLSTRQALAAVGQVHLMGQYNALFKAMKEQCAQVLLTYDTFKSQDQYSNAEKTFQGLLEMGVTPIVNENDTVATQELQSDNDTLSSKVSSMVGADALFLLTDVDGLYTDNPNKNPDAKLVVEVSDISHLEEMCNTSGGEGSTWGTGGMAVKINAARLATSMGIETTIMNAENVSSILEYAKLAENNEDKSGSVPVGTTFRRIRETPTKRKRWIRGLRCTGKIVLDKGAVRALKRRKPLYAVGIIDCIGHFNIFSPIKICDKSGLELGTGISNYSSEEIRLIKGKHSSEIALLELGRTGCVVDRKNMAVYFPKPDAKEPKVRSRIRQGTSDSLGEMELLKLSDSSEAEVALRKVGRRFTYTNFEGRKSANDTASQSSLTSSDGN